ncbi:Isoleucyl-tRNA synthetase [Clostridiaceae bacterium JG1575]|nr:Isoleucyl-tRNA synthetase [Clostridiaceae bacterium JG1575]
MVGENSHAAANEYHLGVGPLKQVGGLAINGVNVTGMLVPWKNRWFTECLRPFLDGVFLFSRRVSCINRRKVNLMYQKIDPKRSFTEMEKDIRSFWRENGIVEKNLKMNEDGPVFSFYDGPPTANGKPHVGHVLTRVIKDIIPRYKNMQGYRVPRKAGWDTHGLPVELEVEKLLGISGKEQIEAYGVDRFTALCKESVFKYTEMWEEMSEAIGYWVDMEHPYVTYNNSYIESVWWALKQMYNKDLLYKGFKVMPYCPRCGTGLSSHEVGQGYKDVTDRTVIARFRVSREAHRYFLAWTTTPWTLPSNVGLAINRSYDYAEVQVGEDTYILAESLVHSVLGDTPHEHLRTFKGSEIEGLHYEQLLPFVVPEGDAFRVVHADYVTLSDGTGIVHTAPAYGEDDYLTAQREGLPMLHLVDAQGRFVDEVVPFAGLDVKKADPKIIDYLKEHGLLFSSAKYTHAYPHCWRCDTPLLYYPRDSWFIRMSAMRERLVDNCNATSWYPDNVRTGRMGKFLEGVIDWALSRDRYWGTPLPIWNCECTHQECIGSIAELKEKGIDVPEDIELHRPSIDAVRLRCPKCGKEMTRTQEVIDAWFDSGSMPFAQHHYPFENKEAFEASFPAQFISEAVDQTRGWFYTLLAISTVLWDQSPYENCLVLGHVLDKNGIKMSKHKGNVVDPMGVIAQEGADAVRWHFYTASAPWLPTRFSQEQVGETQRKFLGTLWNVYSFYLLYAGMDQYNPLTDPMEPSENVMDRWILSRLNTLIGAVEEGLDHYDITGAAAAIETFTDELSNWYVRRNRSRFWSDELTKDKRWAYQTLYRVLTTLSSVAAPFVPFMTEEIYQNLVVNLDPSAVESLHLTQWPKQSPEAIDEELEERMGLAYRIVRLGRAARNQAVIKNRQPLSTLLISVKDLPEYYGEIIKEELNIKEVRLGADLSQYVLFEIKPNLPVLGKAYGRHIPTIRKAIAAANQMELAQSILSGHEMVVPLGEDSLSLTGEHLLVTMQGKEGFAFAGEGEWGVVLDTTITPELKEEGYVREVLSKIQNLRKESGLEVFDHIRLNLGGNEMLQALLSRHLELIQKETLADEVAFEADASAQEVSINGEKIRLALEKA